jgi:hypothetical protein
MTAPHLTAAKEEGEGPDSAANYHRGGRALAGAKPLSAGTRKGTAKAVVAAAKSPDTPAKPMPTIVVATSQKRLKRLRAELRMAQPSEPSPEVDAFFARNVRPGGPLPPKGRDGT